MFGRATLLLLCAATAVSQTPKEVRAAARQGASAFPQLETYLKNPDGKVREEAMKGIVAIGTPKSLDLLMEGTRDPDPGIQIRAVDGLVNFYLPGYVPSGITAPIKRASGSIKAQFGDRNDQIIEPYVKVRLDVVRAIGALVRGGGDSDSRANAARAIGILRGREAESDLYSALKSKDSEVLLESIIAIQKIRDADAGPRVQYLLHDLSEKVQIAAIETTGILKNRAALADLRSVLNTTKRTRVRRAALSAMAMMPDRADRPVYTQYMTSNDDSLRAAAAEGLGRLQEPSDLPMLQQAWKDETKRTALISAAFALVMHGQTQYNDSSPLRFLVQSLDLPGSRNQASPLLVEAARNAEIRLQLYSPLEQGTKEERIAVAQILGEDGDKGTEPHLEKLSHDADPQIAEEGLRALRNLRARL